MAALSCQELIDEIQARIGRPSSAQQIGDTTWLTRRINEGQKLIVENVPLIPSVSFRNTTSLDTTGTTLYAISDITVGDSSTGNRACHITDVWYLDGNESRRLLFVPRDEFDADHPDPTHSDEHFNKPAQWTLRGNGYVELYPYCASTYWDKNLRFDGDYYARDFTTDSTSSSDISRADEGLILYGVWKAWQAIAALTPGTRQQETEARKAWSNPEPFPGESLGWLEEFKTQNDELIAWSGNLYDDAID